MDSSALIKKYVLETGSENILRILDGPGIPVTSKLAYPEVLSGLGRKRREKGITEKDYRAAVNGFESDWEALLIIEFQDELFPLMRQLSSRRATKGADMVHLASAIWIKKRLVKKYCSSRRTPGCCRPPGLKSWRF